MKANGLRKVRLLLKPAQIKRKKLRRNGRKRLRNLSRNLNVTMKKSLHKLVPTTVVHEADLGITADRKAVVVTATLQEWNRGKLTQGIVEGKNGIVEPVETPTGRQEIETTIDVVIGMAEICTGEVGMMAGGVEMALRQELRSEADHHLQLMTAK